MTLQDLLDARNLHLPAQPQHHLPRDAFQDAVAGRWRLDLSFADDEDVLGGTLRNVPLVVEHHRFGCAGVVGFDFCQNIVQIIKALDPGRQGVGVVADHRRGDQRDALFVDLAGVDRD